MIMSIHVPKYTKQITEDLNVEMESSTITVGNFNSPSSETDRSFRKKTSEKAIELNYILDQLDLLSIGHSVQLLQNTCSSQLHVKHPLG